MSKYSFATQGWFSVSVAIDDDDLLISDVGSWPILSNHLVSLYRKGEQLSTFPISTLAPSVEAKVRAEIEQHLDNPANGYLLSSSTRDKRMQKSERYQEQPFGMVQGNYYLITLNDWFYGPDGKTYRVVHGEYIDLFTTLQATSKEEGTRVLVVGDVSITEASIFAVVRTDQFSGAKSEWNIEHEDNVYYRQAGRSWIYNAMGGQKVPFDELDDEDKAFIDVQAQRGEIQTDILWDYEMSPMDQEEFLLADQESDKLASLLSTGQIPAPGPTESQ